MARIEKTVFLSYRRTNALGARAVFQNLTYHGYDVFLDFNGIASGDFESVILENIRARAHFVVLLTPSALKRCSEPGDWLRREIEKALDTRRNIVPLMLEGFDFRTPEITSQLKGTLAALKSYNALPVPAEYFEEAMERLRTKYLNVPLETVLHPASASAVRIAKVQQAAARAAPSVTARELTAQEWYERGVNAREPDEQLRLFDKAIRLKSDYAAALVDRGYTRFGEGDVEGAMKDLDKAIRLDPGDAKALIGRARAREEKEDLEGAMEDFDEAIRLKPGDAFAFYHRGGARSNKGDLAGAIEDFTEAIRLTPYHFFFWSRADARRQKGDLKGAINDYSEVIRLKPDDALAFHHRGGARSEKGDLAGAIADYQKYLDCGAGLQNGDQAEVEQKIRDLREKAPKRWWS